MRIFEDQGYRSVEEYLPAMFKAQDLITRETETDRRGVAEENKQERENSIFLNSGTGMENH